MSYKNVIVMIYIHALPYFFNARQGLDLLGDTCERGSSVGKAFDW